jgi:hypothetical protein
LTTNRINIDNPAEIDGDPAEVKAVVLTQLYEVAVELADYLELADTQLSNAERTAILEREPNLTPNELAERYDSSAMIGRLARLDGAGKVLVKLLTELRKED